MRKVITEDNQYSVQHPESDFSTGSSGLSNSSPFRKTENVIQARIQVIDNHPKYFKDAFVNGKFQ